MDFRELMSLRGFATYAMCHPSEMASSVGPTLNEATFGLLGAPFKPERDLVSVKDKVILVTGGTFLFLVWEYS